MLARLFLLLPLTSVCLLCGCPAGGTSCRHCQLRLPLWQSDRTCRICQVTLPSKSDASYCGRCITDPSGIDAAYCAFAYEGDIARLIAKLKSQSCVRTQLLLTDFWLKAWHERACVDIDVLLPVPMHPWRRYRRGFNQSALFAKALGQQHRKPVLYHAAKQRRLGKVQHELPAKARIENMRGAFAVHTDRVQGRRIAIVDDVLTTGSTLRALAKALKSEGASYVEVWALARAI